MGESNQEQPYRSCSVGLGQNIVEPKIDVAHCVKTSFVTRSGLLAQSAGWSTPELCRLSALFDIGRDAAKCRKLDLERKWLAHARNDANDPLLTSP